MVRLGEVPWNDRGLLQFGRAELFGYAKFIPSSWLLSSLRESDWWPRWKLYRNAVENKQLASTIISMPAKYLAFFVKQVTAQVKKRLDLERGFKVWKICMPTLKNYTSNGQHILVSLHCRSGIVKKNSYRSSKLAKGSKSTPPWRPLEESYYFYFGNL